MALFADVGSVRMLAMTMRFTATLIAGLRIVRPRFVAMLGLLAPWPGMLFTLGTLFMLAMARGFATLVAGVRVMRARFVTMLGLAAFAMGTLFALGARSAPVAM